MNLFKKSRTEYFHFYHFEYPRVYTLFKKYSVSPRHFRLELLPFRRPVLSLYFWHMKEAIFRDLKFILDLFVRKFGCLILSKIHGCLSHFPLSQRRFAIKNFWHLVNFEWAQITNVSHFSLHNSSVIWILNFMIEPEKQFHHVPFCTRNWIYDRYF